MELAKYLKEATNVNTGNIDLSRLSTSLKTNNKSLTSYYETLKKVGSQGEEAFN
jgi:hypothetical protein